MPAQSRYWPGFYVFLLFVAILPILPVRADSWVDSFDTPETSWRIADEQRHALLKKQERVRLADSDQAGSQKAAQTGAERVVYQCQPGLAAWFWCEVPPAAVIEELRVVAELRTTSPGVLLAAEVALPRSLEKNGEPRRVVVRQRPLKPSGVGDIRLVLEDLPRRLQARARVLRMVETTGATDSPTIDIRGAYVTRIGLAVPGDIRAREFWTKRLQIENLIHPPRLPAPEGEGSEQTGPLLTTSPHTSPSDFAGTIVPTRVSVDCEGFRIDGELFFPRVWRWRGEPLDLLARRGFNTIWLEKPLDRRTIESAARKRLRLLAPPPADPSILRNTSLAPVLAWVLPGVSTANNVDARLVSVANCRALPREQQRPVLVETDAPELWSRIADGLLIRSTTSRVSESETTGLVLGRAAASCPPGALILSLVRADLNPSTQEQVDAMLDGAIAPGWLSPRPIGQAVHASLVAGCRGLVFEANEPLDAPDDPTIAAADWLQATNSSLRLIEPWLVGPRPRRASGAETLLLERSRIPIAMPRPFPLGDRQPLVLSGVTEGASLHRVTPAGVSTVAATRATGGIQVSVADSLAPGAILHGHDARVVQSLRKYTAQRGRRAAADLVRLAGAMLKQTDALDPAVSSETKRRVNEANLALARGDLADAYDSAYAAIAAVEAASERRRRIATRAGTAFESSPLAILPATLTDHFTLMSVLPSASRGPNRLAGGSFEDIDAVRRHGWRHDGANGSGAITVELAEGSSIHGDRRLRMTSHEGGGAPARVVSPKINLVDGELVEITGWARVESTTGGRLEIEDSLGGKELSLVLEPNEEWTPFRLLRRAPHTIGLSLSLSLAGNATAEIDGVMLRSIEPVSRRVNSAGRTKAQTSSQPK